MRFGWKLERNFGRVPDGINPQPGEAEDGGEGGAGGGGRGPVGAPPPYTRGERDGTLLPQHTPRVAPPQTRWGTRSPPGTPASMSENISSKYPSTEPGGADVLPGVAESPPSPTPTPSSMMKTRSRRSATVL